MNLQLGVAHKPIQSQLVSYDNEPSGGESPSTARSQNDKKA